MFTYMCIFWVGEKKKILGEVVFTLFIAHWGFLGPVEVLSDI